MIDVHLVKLPTSVEVQPRWMKVLEILAPSSDKLMAAIARTSLGEPRVPQGT